MTPAIRKARPRTGKDRGAAFASQPIGSMNYHEPSITNAAPYRACVSDQEYQIDDIGRIRRSRPLLERHRNSHKELTRKIRGSAQGWGCLSRKARLKTMSL
jgi:hypothetical protein